MRDIVRLAIVALALMGAGACRREPRAAASDSTAARARSAPPAQPQVWRTVAWEPYAGVDPGDLGRGVVYLRRAEDKGATSGTDTLTLHSAPNADSPRVGAMLFTVVPANGTTQYAIAAPDSLRPNLVEYGYEESGIPFDSTDASGHWVHAILGFSPDSTPLGGWVDTTRPGVGLVAWAQQLSDRPIYFPVPKRAAFFATADSSKPLPSPPNGEDAYAIHPEEARGAWLRVRVVEPSDTCEPDTPARRTQRVWIRYLDDRGRPNVWYYPRGC
jgi:hypothetical protein